MILLTCLYWYLVIGLVLIPSLAFVAFYVNSKKNNGRNEEFIQSFIDDSVKYDIDLSLLILFCFTYFCITWPMCFIMLGSKHENN